jgi:hypothetical protein
LEKIWLLYTITICGAFVFMILLIMIIRFMKKEEKIRWNGYKK